MTFTENWLSQELFLVEVLVRCSLALSARSTLANTATRTTRPGSAFGSLIPSTSSCSTTSSSPSSSLSRSSTPPASAWLCCAVWCWPPNAVCAAATAIWPFRWFAAFWEWCQVSFGFVTHNRNMKLRQLLLTGLCTLTAIIVFGIAAPYWGWTHDTGLGLGVPWIPKAPIYKIMNQHFPGTNQK